jgi:hypothetical protein
MTRKIVKQKSVVRRNNTPHLTKRTEAATPVEYQGWHGAYTFFNNRLFADCPLGNNVLIVLQRHAHSRGHYSPNRFSGRKSMEALDEICMNPDAFVDRSDEQILSTLVHEMTHRWQQFHGTPPSRSYHDREWAAKMQQVGLMPSNTGAVGGKRTGKQMSHYIIPGGPFAKAYADLAATGFKLNWQSSIVRGKDKPTNSKAKFSCPRCGQNAWGKPDLQIRCVASYMGTCNTDMVKAE